MEQKETKTRFVRTLQFRPAFDKTDPDPKKNYGIGCVELFFSLRGPKGAVTFSMFSGWYLPHNRKKMVPSEIRWMQKWGKPMSMQPSGAGIHYHSPRRRHKHQSKRECDLLPRGQCYGDVSFTASDPVMEKFIAEGEDAVWEELHRCYEGYFEAKEED